MRHEGNSEETRNGRYLLKPQLGVGAATGLLVGLDLLLLIVDVPQHVRRVVLLSLLHAGILRVHVRSFETQQLLRGEKGRCRTGRMAVNMTSEARGETDSAERLSVPV